MKEVNSVDEGGGRFKSIEAARNALKIPAELSISVPSKSKIICFTNFEQI